MRLWPGRLIVILLFVLLAGSFGTTARSPDSRPNILLIVADDLGYADLGAYGGDIRTPHIDALAGRGRLFTQFHTSPLCSPTRAMLLSGNNNHVAGVGRQRGREDPRVSAEGYEGHLSSRIAPLPRLLREAGYHTLTVGKWHLGTDAAHGPKAAGFERSFGLLDGAANHFNATGFFEGGSVYLEDGETVAYPEGRYSTELYTDRLIEFIDAAQRDGRPFFAFAAYTSPHWPLQVPDAELGRYAGRYDEGYDALREKRFASLKAAGIIPPSQRLPPREATITPWSELTADEQRAEARKMELYAAMVENLDRHLGRLIDHLKTRGLYDDTLIVFMSDNGAAGEDFYNEGEYRDYLRARYDNSYSNMGKATSWVSYGKAWAKAASAPFRLYKGFPTEGGTVAPMIAAGPGVHRRGTKTSAYVTVMDLAPTFLEVAGAPYPTDGSVRPMLGASLASLLRGASERVHADDYVTVLSHRGRAFLRQGRWKITQVESPFRESGFALYDLDADPGETRDLALEQPGKLAELLRLWRARRRQLGIILPDDL
ncbi:MAG: sulfatase [Deltaproteobacteria bacterium]|jgi:arylsulfatase|nr:sulfatase [Deltaproteobacteria bacterium]